MNDETTAAPEAHQPGLHPIEPPTPPARPPMTAARGLQIAQGLLAALVGEVDTIDAHFLANPPKGRALDQAEVEMILRRRRTVSMIEQLRDAAQAMLTAVQAGPQPF